MQAQLQFCQHVVRIADEHMAKQLLYGQLADSTQSQSGQLKCYRDQLRIEILMSS